MTCRCQLFQVHLWRNRNQGKRRETPNHLSQGRCIFGYCLLQETDLRLTLDWITDTVKACNLDAVAIMILVLGKAKSIAMLPNVSKYMPHCSYLSHSNIFYILINNTRSTQIKPNL